MRLRLPTRSRPLRDSDPRGIAPGDAGSSPAPAAFVTTSGCGPDSSRDDAPPRRSRSTPPPPRKTRRMHALRRRPHNDRIARPTPCAPFTERLDMGVVRLHSSTRRARSPMRTPRRLGGFSPRAFTFPTRAVYSIRLSSPGSRWRQRTTPGSPPSSTAVPKFPVSPPGPPPRPAPSTGSSTSRRYDDGMATPIRSRTGLRPAEHSSTHETTMTNQIDQARQTSSDLRE